MSKIPTEYPKKYTNSLGQENTHLYINDNDYRNNARTINQKGYENYNNGHNQNPKYDQKGYRSNEPQGTPQKEDQVHWKNSNRLGQQYNNDLAKKSPVNFETNRTGAISEAENKIETILQEWREKRVTLEEKIEEREEERDAIIDDIGILEDRLREINRVIDKKSVVLDNYKRTIKEADVA
jgi:hypothetical protein